MEVLRLPLDASASPGEALRCLRDEPMPFALTGRWAGGGAVLGASPLRVAAGRGVLAVVDTLPPVDGPADAVGGGWFGVLGFGLASAVERLPPWPPRTVPGPCAVLGLYDHVLRMDTAGRWWFEALAGLEGGTGSEALLRRRDELAARLARPPEPRPWRLEGMTLRGAGADGHRSAVAECVERIAAGELFQANVCLRLDGSLRGSAADAWAEAARRLGPAYGAFVGLEDGAVLSFSPELFLRRTGRQVRTAPIKGTAPRTGDEDSARAAREALAASAKDAAEHVMIVDLMRNDLGRVAEYGSVHAAERAQLEPHPGLWHLVGGVEATLRPGVGDGELLRATFPPGSVTGAPKIQSLKVISELEGTAREAYTGAIGFASPVRGLELNVAIRTLEARGAAAWMGCGGGVVADSVPDAELAEALGKARPVVEALGANVPPVGAPAPRTAPRLPRIARPDPAAGLLETIAVRGGRAVEVERHLTRLAASAEDLFGLTVPAGLRGRVEDSAAACGPVPSRLRIVLRRDGGAEVAASPAQDPPSEVVLRPVLAAGGLGAHKWADRRPMARLDAPARAGLVCDMDGAVLEATTANVWVLEGDRLLTPAADGRILAGVTRARLLGLAGIAGVELREATEPLTLDRVRGAAAIVLSSSIRLAAPAALEGEQPTSAALRLAAELRRTLTSRLACAAEGPVAQLVRAADS
jgi:para-aminobenzoate synthetase / 4-amino-4-deoxychorismate lyase